MKTLNWSHIQEHIFKVRHKNMCSFRFKDDYSFTLYNQSISETPIMPQLNTIADIFPTLSEISHDKAAQLLQVATINELGLFTNGKFKNQAFYDLNDQKNLRKQVCARLDSVLEVRSDLIREVESMKNAVHGGIDYMHCNLVQFSQQVLFSKITASESEVHESHNYAALDEKLNKETHRKSTQSTQSTQSTFNISKKSKWAIIQAFLLLCLFAYNLHVLF